MRVSLPAIFRFLCAAGLAVCMARSGPAQAPPYLHAPSINDYAKHDPAGTTAAPRSTTQRTNGQRLTAHSHPASARRQHLAMTGCLSSWGSGVRACAGRRAYL